MKLMLGAGAATNSFDDIEQAAALLVCGANATACHPVVGDRIRQAALRGVPLIVIDPRNVELAKHAALHLQLRPGTNIPLLNAMANVIVEEGLYDRRAAAQFNEWPEFQRFIAAESPDVAAAICDIPAARIREAARLYATQSPAMCFHGLGLTEHGQGTESVMCLVNLALLTGNVGRPGSGVNPLRGQNNVQGAAHMGCDPSLLPGGVSLAEGRERFESAWSARLPQTSGMNLLEMLDGARSRSFKAMWAIGYDVALTNPCAQDTLDSLQRLELLIVQDLFLNETAHAAAHVFLPACSSFEKSGTFMNSERRIQRVRRVVEPLGDAKPDWEIVCLAAQAMGSGRLFHFRSIEDVWEEIRKVWPDAAGITYHRLERGGLQWPCPDLDHPGTLRLHADLFGSGRRIVLRRVQYRPTQEQPSRQYPFRLMTGRFLYQFNAGTMSSRSLCGVLQANDVIQVSPSDARRLRIHDGQLVGLQSRYGRALVAVRISDAVRSGDLFATFHTRETFLNFVTGRNRDVTVGTPEYKITAVRLDPL
jgi:formate dehydrogenase major subunit